MNGWAWLPVALVAMDLGVLLLAWRRGVLPRWLGLADALANLLTLSGLLAWLRWGGGEQTGWALLWLMVLYLWSLAMPLLADWRHGRPLDRLRFWVGIADAVCLAAVAGYLFYDHPAGLTVLWFAMAAGYGATAAFFRAHVPDDRRGAGLYLSLATFMLALTAGAWFRGPDGPAGRPHGAVALIWILLGPAMVAWGVWRRYPLARYIGLGLIGLLTARALYDCRPPEDTRHHGPAAAEAPAAKSKPRARTIPGPATPTAETAVETPEEEGEDGDEIPVEAMLEPVIAPPPEPIETMVVWVRPWWLLAMAPASMFLAALALQSGQRRGRRERREGPIDAPPPSPPRSFYETREGLDAWLAAAAALSAYVLALFFLHLEWTAWLTYWGTMQDDVYYANAVGTAVLWSFAAIPLLLWRRGGAGARWTGVSLLAIAWVAALSLAWRAAGIVATVPPWDNARPLAYAAGLLALTLWAFTCAKPASRRAAKILVIALAALCLAGEVAAWAAA